VLVTVGRTAFFHSLSEVKVIVVCSGMGEWWVWGSNRELACFLHIRSAREQLGHSAQVPLVSWLPCASPYPASLFFVIRRPVLVNRLGVVDFCWEGG